MFRCDSCKKTIGPRVAEIHRITETRKVTYLDGSTGVEIVKEIKQCEPCSKLKVN